MRTRSFYSLLSRGYIRKVSVYLLQIIFSTLLQYYLALNNKRQKWDDEIIKTKQRQDRYETGLLLATQEQQNIYQKKTGTYFWRQWATKQQQHINKRVILIVTRQLRTRQQQKTVQQQFTKDTENDTSSSDQTMTPLVIRHQQDRNKTVATAHNEDACSESPPRLIP